MKISPLKAVFLFCFSRRRFYDLAMALSKTQSAGEWKFPETPTLRLRDGLLRSFLVVVIAIALGWLTGELLERYLGPASRTQLSVLQYLGIAIILWATLGKGGWNIQTYKGESLPEKVDRWIYFALYFLGSFFFVVSAAWPSKAG